MNKTMNRVRAKAFADAAAFCRDQVRVLTRLPKTTYNLIRMKTLREIAAHFEDVAAPWRS